MVFTLLKVLGWIIALTPEWILHALTLVIAELIYWASPKRRRLILSNLHHVYPDKPGIWHTKMAKTCLRRLTETGFLSLATPYLSEKRIRKIAHLSNNYKTWLTQTSAKTKDEQKPVVYVGMHLALWESLTWLPLLSPVKIPEYGIIFRPLDSEKADDYVRTTRGRFGMKLLSRKEGFAQAMRILRDKGCIGILIDQNAGMQGALTTFLGRVCSTTELPAVLATKFNADIRTFFPRRTGFWRATFDSEPIIHDGTSQGITIAINQWLEKALEDENLSAAWLWGHDRWRHQDMPSKRLRLESKRDLLSDELKLRNLENLPRNTRLWIRMPNWLGDVVMALPLIRAIRKARPDAEIHLLAKGSFAHLLDKVGCADYVHALPKQNISYFKSFWRLRKTYPDVWICLTNSVRGDIEAWLTRCPQRFGIKRVSKSRPLLTHTFNVPASFDESKHHQTELWNQFLAHFGLLENPVTTPIFSTAHNAQGPIALLPGSENSPEKRWPVDYFRKLIQLRPTDQFVILGTPTDVPIADAIAANMDNRVTNQCGKTTLLGFAEELSKCRLVISNDSGGLHLANALGVPVIGLYGPTNPLRTGPVFSSPFILAQPEGCPATGGKPLSELTPEAVNALILT